jgi:salicylate hydroxylase
MWNCRASNCSAFKEKRLWFSCIGESSRIRRCWRLVDDDAKWVCVPPTSIPSLLISIRLKVLSLIGLADIVTETGPHLLELRDETFSGDLLGISQLPATWTEKYGQPACGVRRTVLNLALKEKLIEEKIELVEGWQLKNAIESKDSVVVISQDGRQQTGSFLIGCDGIKSVTRSLVLEQHGISEGPASYTSLTQVEPHPSNALFQLTSPRTGGSSPTPQALLYFSGMLNIYGPGAHVICYPISLSLTSWAITQRTSFEARETWQGFSLTDSPDYRAQLLEQFKEWSSVVWELIKGADRLIQYGLYDRPQLEPEHWVGAGGRCVLLGDAAHPTSPHLGQGANQAL